MSSSARHARKKHTRTRPAAALLRAGLTVTAAGAVVAGAGGTASADEGRAPSGQQPVAGANLEPGKTELPLGGVGEGLDAALTGGTGPVKKLQLNPLAGTGTDPLDNVVSTQVADFKPLSTEAVTGSLSDGASLEELPLVGEVAGLLPG